MSRKTAESAPRILVVDDTPENLQIVGETLSRQLTCDLSFATDGRQALESAKEYPPDLILLDVMMPGMDGYAACRALKADPATAEIPVLFLTAKVEATDVAAGFDAGAVDYIAKPFNPIELVARVRTQLRIRRAEEERVRYEAQLRQIQKTESLNRMAGAVAHNFNNQLQSVLGNLELALEDLPPGSGTAGLLKTSLQAGRRAAEMGGLMLTYLGHAPGRFAPVDFGEVCRVGLAGIEAERPPGVELKVEMSGAGPVVKAAAAQIQQVLTHLVRNAWEAIGEKGGAIRVSLRAVSAREISEKGRFPPEWAPKEGPYACLEVADTGGGIAAGDLEKIFDPFFTTKFTGRGLGLSVALGIVRAHGGCVTVESEVGRGSVFRVHLPVTAEAAPAPAAGTGASARDDASTGGVVRALQPCCTPYAMPPKAALPKSSNADQRHRESRHASTQPRCARPASSNTSAAARSTIWRSMLRRPVA